MHSQSSEKDKPEENKIENKIEEQVECRMEVLPCGRKAYHFAKLKENVFVVDSQYELTAIKGYGTYGIVVSGTHLLTKQAIAVKKISNIFRNLGDTKRILREIKILKFLKHRNIVGLRDIMSIPDRNCFDEIYLTMDYMEYNLHRLIHSKQVAITESMIQFILFQLLNATNFMHSADIIHRDLKPENILVNKKCELKIADMNLARKETLSDDFTYYVTSRPYRAPEIYINSSAYTKAIDIWSIGCIFAELLGKTVLFQGEDYIDQLRKFVAILGKPSIDTFPNVDPIAAQGLARVFKEIPDREKVQWSFLFPRATEKALALLDKMLVYDAKARFTAEECLNSSFLEDYKSRSRSICKENFDFSFDDMEMTQENLRNAISEEAQEFKERRHLRKESDPDFTGEDTRRKIPKLNESVS